MFRPASVAVVRLISAPTVLALILGLFGAFSAPAPTRAISPDIVISEVYGGGGNSGAPFTHDFIEIYNRGATPVDLTGWSVQYASATGTGTFADNSPVALAGTLPPGRHYLVQNASGGANGVPLPTPDATGTIAMALGSGKVVAVRPGATLGLACNGSSDPCDAAETARIADLVGYGNANFFETAPTAVLTNTTSAKRLADGATDSDDNSTDFTVLGALSPTNCGADCLPPPPPADIVISQLYGGGGNSGAPFSNDYIELFNRGSAPVSLSGWSVQYGSATGTTWQVTLLTGSIAAGRYYLVQEAAGATASTPLPTPDATGTIAMGASAGKVALVRTTTALTCGSDCDAASDVQDFVGYGTTANDFEGSGPAPAPSNTLAAIRNNDGATDTNNNAADFTAGSPMPRNSALAPPVTGCEVPATHQIADVQGAGDTTPLIGTLVRVEGVVTGDFNDDATGLGGFYIQDDTPDADAATSDGIFVFGTSVVAEGDRVLVSGTASENFSQTQIGGATVDVCGTGTIAPANYDLPRPMGVTFEPVEGVLLTFPEALSVTEHFQLGRFGEVTVSADGRLFQPTDLVEPGAPAIALLEENQRRRLLIDDGSSVQNPFVVPYLDPDAVRIGDSATGITGVLGFGFGVYRLQPTDPIAFARTNPRPEAPADVGGDIKVASFNTLNYFTTLTTENPNARGANSVAEFERQQVKEVEAILALDADIIGLMEIENNGAEAVDNLVAALNAATAPGTYASIVEPALNPPNEFGGTFGTDAIKVAFIYRPASVTPVGTAQTSADPVFDRPPLIQTFELVGGSEDVTIAVNHFKSKSCGGATGADADQGDGQSCYNARRLLQAQALLDALGTLELPNPLIIGDLNSYTEEDPIHLIEDAGYTGLSEAFMADADRYSFVFDGFSGELDHALAGADLVDDVTGATIWHINADEPLILDYNLDFGRDPAIYEPDAFRSSDHDPLIVGLDLAETPAAPEVNATAGWGAVTVEWEAPDDGGLAITGYEVTASAGGSEVASVSVGGDTLSHTFGDLTNGVTYTFEVVATNEIGSGPAGSDTATPFVPKKYAKLDADLECPTFTVTNENDFPVDISWLTNRGASGNDVVAADSTIVLDVTVGRKTTVLLLFAGGKLQDVGHGRC